MYQHMYFKFFQFCVFRATNLCICKRSEIRYVRFTDLRPDRSGRYCMHTVDFFCKPLWTQDMRDESEAMDDQRPVGITQSHCFANAVAILLSWRMMNALPL